MKKGFTLIELLAVIVILAIIALIATPIILGIINDAKEDSNKRSVENYAHAVELAVARYATKQGGLIEEGDYTIEGNGKTIISPSSERIQIDYKGEAIKKGSLKVLSGGKIELLEISFDGKSAYNYSEKDGVTKNESSEGGESYISSPYKVTDSGILLHYERQGDETSVKVPAEVNGVKITSIATEAFLDGDAIMIGSEMIIIGLTPESEGKYKNLAEDNGGTFVMIEEFGKGNDPVNLTTEIFYGSGIGKISAEESDKGGPTFSNQYENACYLTDIDLSDMKYLENITLMAFSGCSDIVTTEAVPAKLNIVKFPMNGNLTVIEDDAFIDNNINAIELPNTLTRVGNGAFRGNNITTVTIPASVTTLGDNSFGAVSTVKVLGDSSRFDSNWYEYFRNATKITE